MRCSFFIHTRRWEPMQWVSRKPVQYGTCIRCGHVRAREVLLD